MILCSPLAALIFHIYVRIEPARLMSSTVELADRYPHRQIKYCGRQFPYLISTACRDVFAPPPVRSGLSQENFTEVLCLTQRSISSYLTHLRTLQICGMVETMIFPQGRVCGVMRSLRHHLRSGSQFTIGSIATVCDICRTISMQPESRRSPVYSFARYLLAMSKSLQRRLLY
jgi:hypothetical protein